MTGSLNLSMVETTDLTKKYGSFTALHELNLEVNEGELFVYLGANGAGKTTTIKILTTLLRPTYGYASVCGLDVTRFPIEVKKLMGYVPENPAFYEKLTGKEFLSFVAEMRKVEDKKKKVEALLEIFELSKSADELIETYSLGMRKKIAISSALIHSPKVLFLDEPTGGLDPKSARLVKDMLRGLCDQGSTVFMTTHILEVAERMCDRVGIIKNGHLIKVGTMEELRSQAKSNQASLEDIFLELTETEGEV